MSPTIFLDSPPLTPDADTARYWLKTELSQRIYGENESLFSKLWRGLTDFLDRLTFQAPPSVGMAVLVVLIMIVVVLAIFFGGRLRVTKRNKTSATVFEDTETTAKEYWDRAQQAAQTQDLAGAVLYSFRALVRSAEERVVISEQPGRTAVEAAGAIGQELPTDMADLSRAAHLFDQVVYGDRTATFGDYEFLTDLGHRLEQTPQTQPAQPTTTPVGGHRP